MPRVYLTIDDSPSDRTDDLTDALAKKRIPALLFCRGDHLERDPQPIIRAIQKGFVIGNHGYSHVPFGSLSYVDCVDEIEKTEKLIEAAYKQAQVRRPGRYFRFPYLDRGDGDRLERRFDALAASVQEGGRAGLASTGKVEDLQNYLHEKGFTQPFEGVTHPLYGVPEIAGAADCLATYSACDWMLHERYKGHQPFDTPAALREKMQDDPFLTCQTEPQIILMHDHAEICDEVMALISYLQEQSFSFMPVCSQLEESNA